mgnify:CR=1 FL=1
MACGTILCAAMKRGREQRAAHARERRAPAKCASRTPARVRVATGARPRRAHAVRAKRARHARMVHAGADQPTVEEMLETQLELKKAVYYRWWERVIEAALNGEDVSGCTLRQGEQQWVQAGHNSSTPASDDEDGSGPGAKRRWPGTRKMLPKTPRAHARNPPRRPPN